MGSKQGPAAICALPFSAATDASIRGRYVMMVTPTRMMTVLMIVRSISRTNGPLFWMVFAALAGFAGMFLFYGLTDLGTLWPMPQWIIFLAVAGLMVWGERRA